jgi:hypothetical protein
MIRARRLPTATEIRDVVLEIERRRPGLLYYMICVKLTLDFNSEDAIAKKVVQRLYKALTSSVSRQQAEIEMAFANSLAAASRDQAPPPQPPTLDPGGFASSPQKRIPHPCIGCCRRTRDAVSSLGQTLFSRLRGLPGDRFLVCCDEVYFNNEIMGPRRARMAEQLRPLQLRPPIPVQQYVGAAGAMVRGYSLLIAAGHTALRIIDDPTRLFTAREEFLKAYKWLEQHPAHTLIIGSAVVYGTALIIASAGTAGAVAMYGGGAAAGVAAESGLGLAVESGMARGLASESLASAALPSVER